MQDDSIEIKLISSDDIFSIVPLLRVLNTDISESILKKRLTEMVAQGYRCAGLYSNNELVGICGIWIITKYYSGRHVEPDNVMILPEYRSQKLGTILMDWVHQYAQSQGCTGSELNCYLDNKQGHRFWEKQGFEKIAFRFQKTLA